MDRVARMLGRVSTMDDYIYRVGVNTGRPVYVTARSIAEAYTYLVEDCGWERDAIGSIEAIDTVLIGPRG